MPHNDAAREVENLAKRRRKRVKYSKNTTGICKVNSQNKNDKKIKPAIGIQCPICFNDLTDEPVSSTKCGHIFCTACLKRALWFKPMCPKCRQSLRGPRRYHPIFLDFTKSEDSNKSSNHSTVHNDHE